MNIIVIFSNGTTAPSALGPHYRGFTITQC